MNKTVLPVILILAAIGTGVYWYLMVKPTRIDIPSQTTLFAPDHCGFKVRMAGTPEISRQMRGELPIETATAKHAGVGAVKVSCGPYIVLDMQAFETHLPEQMERAAKNAGLKQIETSVRRNGDRVTAHYEGVKGEGGLARRIRSETHVQNQQFVEILYMLPEAVYSESNLARLAAVDATPE